MTELEKINLKIDLREINARLTDKTATIMESEYTELRNKKIELIKRLKNYGSNTIKK